MLDKSLGISLAMFLLKVDHELQCGLSKQADEIWIRSPELIPKGWIMEFVGVTANRHSLRTLEQSTGLCFKGKLARQ